MITHKHVNHPEYVIHTLLDATIFVTWVCEVSVKHVYVMTTIHMQTIPMKQVNIPFAWQTTTAMPKNDICYKNMTRAQLFRIRDGSLKSLAYQQIPKDDSSQDPK